MSDDRMMVFNSEPNSGSYKGFRLNDTIKTKAGAAKMTFTNGQDNFDIIGNSIEDAYSKAFDRIDLLAK